MYSHSLLLCMALICTEETRPIETHVELQTSFQSNHTPKMTKACLKTFYLKENVIIIII